MLSVAESFLFLETTQFIYLWVMQTFQAHAGKSLLSYLQLIEGSDTQSQCIDL